MTESIVQEEGEECKQQYTTHTTDTGYVLKRSTDRHHHKNQKSGDDGHRDVEIPAVFL